MGKGHFGHYSGNARHSHTPVTKKNYRASVADDAAHIHYLKEDINYDAKHGHSDENMTADEKHISKLAGDMKYDKKHHSPLNDNHGKIDPKTGKKITYRLKGTSHMYDDEGFLKPEFGGESNQNYTPEKMYTRDLGIDQGTYGTADYIPGRKYSQEGREIGSIGDRIKQKPGYRYQFTSVSGDTDVDPNNPFIRQDFNEQGDLVENAEVLGEERASGLIGRSFSQQDVEEMKGRYNRYMAPKRKAEEYFKSKKS